VGNSKVKQEMKIGDLIEYQPPQAHLLRRCFGTVVDFPPVSHPKQFQKVKVLTETGMEDWIMQFCEVISESR